MKIREKSPAAHNNATLSILRGRGKYVFNQDKYTKEGVVNKIKNPSDIATISDDFRGIKGNVGIAVVPSRLRSEVKDPFTNQKYQTAERWSFADNGWQWNAGGSKDSKTALNKHINMTETKAQEKNKMPLAQRIEDFFRKLFNGGRV